MFELTAPSDTFNPTFIRYHFSVLHYLAQKSGYAGVLVLAAFGDDLPSAQPFAIGDVDGMTNAALAFHASRNNVYAPLAVMRPDLEPGKKGAEGDVVAVLGFVIDADSDHAGVAKPAMPPGFAASYVVETSTGNEQLFLFLDRALPPLEGKAYGEALHRSTGGAFAEDISHVWRVPGTLNWPNATKLKRGRSAEPQSVRLLKTWDGIPTGVDHLRSVLEPHWRVPRIERQATAAGQTKYINDPAKCEALLIRLRDAGYFAAGPDARRRYTRAAKACSFDLGEEVGRPIWERVVCWSGERDDEGELTTADEMDERWKDCSSLKP